MLAINLPQDCKCLPALPKGLHLYQSSVTDWQVEPRQPVLTSCLWLRSIVVSHMGCPHERITQSQFNFISSHNPQDESGDEVNSKVV